MNLTSSGIYKIINRETCDCYVGSAVNISNRWSRHKRELRKNKHHSQYLQNAWNKYGEDAFDFEMLLICDKQNLLMYEQIMLNGIQPSYNMAKFAGSNIGVRRTDRQKQIIGNFHRGKVLSTETKKKISDSLTGRVGVPMSEEHKQRLREIQKEKNYPGLRKFALQRTGVPRTKEVKEKLSKAVGKFSSEEIVKIRQMYASGMLQKEIAEVFNVRQSSICEIVSRITYRWVD